MNREPQGYIQLFPGEYYNVECALEEYEMWKRKINTATPADRHRIHYWLDAMKESREDLAKHGITWED